MENLQVKKINREGRNFEFRFWDDTTFPFALHYAGVYEIFEPKRFLFWTINDEKVINSGWGMEDRVEWCKSILDSYLQEEKVIAADILKVNKFVSE